MDGLQGLREERRRLLGEITRLSSPVGPYPAPRAEDVWRRLRAAAAAYRLSLLPHLRAMEETLGARIQDLDADDHTMVAVTLLRSEIEHGLVELDEIEAAVLEQGLTPTRLLAATRSLAGLRSLAVVVLRLVDEVVVPRLESLLTEHEADSLADALMAYEHVLSKAS